MIAWTNIFMGRSSKRIGRKGHQYLDDLIATAISKSGFFDNKMATYHGSYLKLIAEDRRESVRWGSRMLPFIKGYCAMKEISACEHNKDNVDLISVALQSFDAFLLKEGMGSELGYIAAWQAASLGARLDLPWPEAEEKLLNAAEAFPERGEAIREIVVHYISESEYKVAYIYTSHCMVSFLGNVPKRNNKWCVNVPFYNWQVLEYHLSCCQVLKNNDEAFDAYRTLKNIMIVNPEYFSLDDMKRLEAYDRWVERDALVSETEGYDKILSK